MEGKNIYSDEVGKMVAIVYRKKSPIYVAMMNGEQISGLIRQSIIKKGNNPRIGDKKKLYKLCKEEEMNIQENNFISNSN